VSELLRTVDLTVGFGGADADVPPVLEGVSVALDAGEAVALTGPSGAGKTVFVRALLGLLPRGAHRTGSILWQGEDLTARPGGWAALRGPGLALVPQEPATGLDPLVTVGAQVAETAAAHGARGREAWRRVHELFAEVRLPDPARVARAYPHELSGGQRQRVLLAAALACDPRLLIADEPTTALDVTVQKEIVRLLAAVRRERGMALLFITHDLDLAPLLAERRWDLQQRRLVEAPLGRAPSGGPSVATAAPTDAPVLRGEGITVVHTGAPRGAPPAVREVDIDLYPGRAWGLAGESGCGKTSLARALAGHLHPHAGRVTLAGREHAGFGGAAGRARRRLVQLLFQDPAASLNPRQTVGAALREAAGDGRPVAPLLAEVGLDAAIAARLPHALSGGQRQRVALARCLAADPLVLIADEPSSALDPATRERIMGVLHDAMLRRRLGVLLISHDLGLLHRHCGGVTVMRDGIVVEIYPTGLPGGPRHPYTLELLAAQPSRLAGPPQAWPPATGPTPSADAAPGVGCPHADRCAYRKSRCVSELPPLKSVGPGHWLRCPERESAAPSQFIDTI